MAAPNLSAEPPACPLRNNGDTVPSCVAFVHNHLPRRCGIATFTTDLCSALSSTLPSFGHSRGPTQVIEQHEAYGARRGAFAAFEPRPAALDWEHRRGRRCHEATVARRDREGAITAYSLPR